MLHMMTLMESHPYTAQSISFHTEEEIRYRSILQFLRGHLKPKYYLNRLFNLESIIYHL